MSLLVVYGTGGMGREALQLALDCHAAGTGLAPHGYLDERVALHGTLLNGYPVLGGGAWLAANPHASVVLGIGSPVARRRVEAELQRIGSFTYPTLVHPSAILGTGTTLGAGTLVAARCVVTTNVTVGQHTIVNLGCTLSHDVSLSDFATLACGVHVSGNVRIEEGADVGVGANIVQGRQVGAWSVVGAGATVVRDVPRDSTVVGCPANVVKRRLAGWHL